MRWSPVLAAVWLATLAGCADLWLDPPLVAAAPARCPPGSSLDTKVGACVAGLCRSTDDCRAGFRCDGIAGVCRLPIDSSEPIVELPVECADGAVRCGDGGRREICEDARWVGEPCPGATTCHGGACLTCRPSSRHCADEGSDGNAAYQICTSDGGGWLTVACADPRAACIDGHCRICTPGESRCTDVGPAVCSANGTAWQAAPCGADSFCTDSGGSASCAPIACVPSSSSCDPLDPNRRLVCADDGSRLAEVACPAGSTCRQPGGACVDACTIASVEGHGAGCDYWFAQLPNGSALHAAQHEIVLQVSNPNALAATLRLTSARHTAPLIEGLVVQPGLMQAIALPPQALLGTDRGSYGFHLESSLPVVAQLLNRIEGEDRSACACSADGCESSEECTVVVSGAGGTLLLPQHLLAPEGEGSTYVAWSPRHRRARVHQPALLAIVGTRNSTSVTVEFTADTKVGANGEVESYAAGDTAGFLLDAGSVLQFATRPTGALSPANGWPSVPVEYANDFAGTIIRSDAPLAIFTGADRVGSSQEASADHLLEQLPPLSQWGRRYVGLVANAADRFVLVGGKSPVLLAFNGDVVDDQGEPLQVVTIAASGSLRFRANGDFSVSAGNPVLLLQVVGGDDGRADAGLLVVPPLERSRPTHRFQVAPGGTTAVQLIAPRTGAAGVPPVVRIAGDRVEAWTPLAGTDRQVARIELCVSGAYCNQEGAYAVESTDPVLLFVHEHGDAAICYAGGMGGDSGFSRPKPY